VLERGVEVRADYADDGVGSRHLEFAARLGDLHYLAPHLAKIHFKRSLLGCAVVLHDAQLGIRTQAHNRTII